MIIVNSYLINNIIKELKDFHKKVIDKFIG